MAVRHSISEKNTVQPHFAGRFFQNILLLAARFDYYLPNKDFYFYFPTN